MKVGGWRVNMALEMGTGVAVKTVMDLGSGPGSERVGGIRGTVAASTPKITATKDWSKT